MGRLSDVRARLSCFSEIVEQVETLQAEMAYAAEESPHASMVKLWCTYGAHVGRYLPLSLAPILDTSVIRAGIAIGWHSAPLPGDTPAGVADSSDRLLMGRLLYAAKQYDSTLWSTDKQDVQQIGELAAYALASTHFGQQADLIVAVPSSRATNSLPYQVAKDVAFLTGVRYAPADTVVFGRQLPQIKQITDYWQKRELLHGAMEAEAETLRNRYVVLLDDICRSGATLHECARACHQAGASGVSVLVVSKTFRFQRIPVVQAEFNAHGMEA